MVETEKLKEKLMNMPDVKQRIRRITAKDGREWYVLETVITKFLSPKYIEKVVKGDKKPEGGLF